MWLSNWGTLGIYMYMYMYTYTYMWKIIYVWYTHVSGWREHVCMCVCGGEHTWPASQARQVGGKEAEQGRLVASGWPGTTTSKMQDRNLAPGHLPRGERGRVMACITRWLAGATNNTIIRQTWVQQLNNRMVDDFCMIYWAASAAQLVRASARNNE